MLVVKNKMQVFFTGCCAARGHALAVWLRLVPRRPNSLRPAQRCFCNLKINTKI